MAETTEDRINRLAIESNAATILAGLLTQYKGDLKWFDNDAMVQSSIGLAMDIRLEVSKKFYGAT